MNNEPGSMKVLDIYDLSEEDLILLGRRVSYAFKNFDVAQMTSSDLLTYFKTGRRR